MNTNTKTEQLERLFEWRDRILGFREYHKLDEWIDKDKE